MVNIKGASLAPIYERLASATEYNPSSGNTFADWSVQGGDIVTMTQDGENYVTPVFSTTMRWTGSPTTTIETTGNENTDSIQEMAQKKYTENGNGYKNLTNYKVFNVGVAPNDPNLLVITKANGEVINFSKAVSLSGVWGGGGFKVTAKQNGRSVKEETLTYLSSELLNGDWSKDTITGQYNYESYKGDIGYTESRSPGADVGNTGQYVTIDTTPAINHGKYLAYEGATVNANVGTWNSGTYTYNAYAIINNLQKTSTDKSTYLHTSLINGNWHRDPTTLVTDYESYTGTIGYTETPDGDVGSTGRSVTINTTDAITYGEGKAFNGSTLTANKGTWSSGNFSYTASLNYGSYPTRTTTAKYTYLHNELLNGVWHRDETTLETDYISYNGLIGYKTSPTSDAVSTGMSVTIDTTAAITHGRYLGFSLSSLSASSGSWNRGIFSYYASLSLSPYTTRTSNSKYTYLHNELIGGTWHRDETTLETDYLSYSGSIGYKETSTSAEVYNTGMGITVNTSDAVAHGKYLGFSQASLSASDGQWNTGTFSYNAVLSLSPYTARNSSSKYIYMHNSLLNGVWHRDETTLETDYLSFSGSIGYKRTPNGDVADTGMGITVDTSAAVTHGKYLGFSQSSLSASDGAWNSGVFSYHASLSLSPYSTRTSGNKYTYLHNELVGGTWHRDETTLETDYLSYSGSIGYKESSTSAEVYNTGMGITINTEDAITHGKSLAFNNSTLTANTGTWSSGVFSYTASLSYSPFTKRTTSQKRTYLSQTLLNGVWHRDPTTLTTDYTSYSGTIGYSETSGGEVLSTGINVTIDTRAAITAPVKSQVWAWVGGAQQVVIEPQHKTLTGSSIRLSGVTFLPNTVTWSENYHVLTQTYYAYDVNGTACVYSDLGVDTTDAYNAGARNVSPLLSGSWNNGTLTVTSTPASADNFVRLLQAGTAYKSNGKVKIPINTIWGASGEYSESTGWEASYTLKNPDINRVYTSASQPTGSNVELRSDLASTFINALNNSKYFCIELECDGKTKIFYTGT